MKNNNKVFTSMIPSSKFQPSALTEGSVLRLKVMTPNRTEVVFHCVMLGHASHKSGDEQKRIALDTGAAMILAANRVSSPQIYAESDLSLDSNDVADSQEDFMNDQSKFAKQLKDLLLNSTDEAVKQNVIDRKLLELWDEFRTPV